MTKVWQVCVDLEPYILQILLGAIALFALSKDWDDYVTRLGKLKTLFLFAATIIVIFLTLLDTHSTRKDTREKEQIAASKDAASTKQVEILTEQVRLEREENKQNSDGFRISFTSLYDKYSDLASRVRNSDLLRELHQTQSDLKETQSKLAQPKATLTASFWHPNMSSANLTKDITVSKKADGSVTLDIMVLNTSDTAALNGTYTIRICVGCKFAKEPEGFMHFKGSEEQDRQVNFDRILSKSTDEKRTIEVFPPQPLATLPNRFEIDMWYSCVNCVTDRIPLWVSVQ